MTVVSKAEHAAQELLDRYSVTEPPIPVYDLAATVGVAVVHEPFADDGVSGVLVREPGRTMIAVNSANAPVRQRFTVAHEIGHLLLHQGAIYLDGRARINFRSGSSSTTSNEEEIEANAFAAALLMPAEWMHVNFRTTVQERDIQSEDELTDLLAVRFDVSAKAMHFRLVDLGLFASP